MSGVPGETTFILPGPLDGAPGFFGQFNYRISSLLQGAELNGLFKWMQFGRFRMDGFAGLFWADLHENSTFTANTGTVANYGFSPGFFRFSDRFITTNQYMAAQLGLKMTYLTKQWRVKGKVKGAAGTNWQTLKIAGASQTPSGNEWFTTVGTGSEILPGGAFANPSNVGRYRKLRFTGGFDGEFQASFRFNRYLEVEVGYTFLWIWKVLRPGKQIDRKINSTTTFLADASRATVGVGSGPIPFGSPGPAPGPRGPSRPKILFRSSSFWAQGVNAGMQVRF